MHLKPLFSLIMGLLGLTACNSKNDDLRIEQGKWVINYQPQSKKLDIVFDGRLLLKEVYAKFKIGDQFIESNSYNAATLKQEVVSNALGKGRKYSIVYKTSGDQPALTHVFYFYDDKDYFTTEILVNGAKTALESNYMAPLVSNAENVVLPKDVNNRVLRVPFDNDNFVTYLSSPLAVTDTSIEVTAIFNGTSRNGLVIGSVEHDNWKTGIKYTAADNEKITQLECFGGVANELTRDVSSKPGRTNLGHGALKGQQLKSPLLLVGFFDDWRRGLEIYGEANAAIAPPRQWKAGTPFGWNSWAAMAEQVNYDGAIAVADFIKKELQPNNFEDDNTVFIGLDSFWDNFSEEQLKSFVDNCKLNGQHAGIYWCPFSDWGGDGEKVVEGTNGQYKYKETYLRADGKPRKIESLAMDPTHPATKMRIDQYINKFKSLGFTYVKLDFINNGALEADQFFDPTVTTGVQAYNVGMKYLTEKCGDDLFLALSIAPAFPAQYGSARRISCDTWGAMTEAPHGSTGYMLNSLSFGWWLDRVYPYNDADHILLYKQGEEADYRDGANRARVTSAVITGIYMLGDNLADKGKIPGNPIARSKARAFTTNKDINEIARIGKSFYPVEGYTAAEPDKTETVFMYNTPDYLYVAVFNFDKLKIKEGNLSFDRLGLSSSNNNSVKELWTAQQVLVKDNHLPYSVPAQDARVYRISKK